MATIQTEAPNTNGVGKIVHIQPVSRYVRNSARWGLRYDGNLIETCMRFVEWRYFQ